MDPIAVDLFARLFHSCDVMAERKDLVVHRVEFLGGELREGKILADDVEKLLHASLFATGAVRRKIFRATDGLPRRFWRHRVDNGRDIAASERGIEALH